MSWRDFYRIVYVPGVSYLGDKYYVVDIATDKKLIGLLYHDNAIAYAERLFSGIESDIEKVVFE